MNDQKEIEWTLRFEKLLDGQTFIAGKVILLDETYFSAGEIESASPRQCERATEILSTPTSVAIELEDLVPNGGSYDLPGVIRLVPRCVDFLNTLAFRDKLRFKIAPAEDPFVHIFDGELLIGSMTPITAPRERSEKERRKVAKERAADIPSVIIEKAEEGHPAAFRSMAMFYGRIYDLCTDYGVEYLKWMTRAAESGDSRNQYNLAGMYFHGEVVSQDYAEAFKWYREASDQDDPDATWRAGAMLATGIGTKEDPVAGLQLVEKAIELGSERAIQVRTFMREILSENDVKAAHENLIRQLENKT
jgi:hypothetical protein